MDTANRKFAMVPVSFDCLPLECRYGSYGSRRAGRELEGNALEAGLGEECRRRRRAGASERLAWSRRVRRCGVWRNAVGRILVYSLGRKPRSELNCNEQMVRKCAEGKRVSERNVCSLDCDSGSAAGQRTFAIVEMVRLGLRRVWLGRGWKRIQTMAKNGAVPGNACRGSPATPHDGQSGAVPADL